MCKYYMFLLFDHHRLNQNDFLHQLQWISSGHQFTRALSVFREKAWQQESEAAGHVASIVRKKSWPLVFILSSQGSPSRNKLYLPSTYKWGTVWVSSVFFPIYSYQCVPQDHGFYPDHTEKTHCNYGVPHSKYIHPVKFDVSLLVCIGIVYQLLGNALPFLPTAVL